MSDDFRNILGTIRRVVGEDAVNQALRHVSEQDTGIKHLVDVKSADFRTAPKKEPPKTDPPPDTTAQQAVVPPPAVQNGGNAHTKSSSEQVIRAAIRGEYLYSILALILGLSSIICGTLLGINGVAGHTSFTASLLGLSTTVNDAAPGVILFVVGLFMIWATRPKVKLGDLVG